MSKKSFREEALAASDDDFPLGAPFDFYKPRARFVEHYDFGPSMTRQEFADDCDINSIMARYETTGNLHAPFAKDGLHYADYTDVPDLMTAMNLMSVASDDFMSLPAKVRREFDNDPVAFVNFASDPSNLDQMRIWGLAPPAPQERPQAAPELNSIESSGDLVKAP